MPLYSKESIAIVYDGEVVIVYIDVELVNREMR